ncbi:hypothetical protein LL947_00945 [Halomonas sp. BLK-85]
MTNPLEGLDPEDQRMLAKLAEDKGLTLLEARRLHDKASKGICDLFLKTLAEQGRTIEDLNRECEAEQSMVDFIYQTTGVRVSGRWGIAANNYTGAKVRSGAEAGHKHTHGTKEKKQQQWDSYQGLLDEKLANNPNLSLTTARGYVAKEVGVSLKTIQRHTEDPRK